MNTDTPGSRRQFFATLLSGALCAGTSVLSAFGRARASHAMPHDGDEPRRHPATSDELLASMNDLTGILEP